MPNETDADRKLRLEVERLRTEFELRYQQPLERVEAQVERVVALIEGRNLDTRLTLAEARLSRVEADQASAETSGDRRMGEVWVRIWWMVGMALVALATALWALLMSHIDPSGKR